MFLTTAVLFLMHREPSGAEKYESKHFTQADAVDEGESDGRLPMLSDAWRMCMRRSISDDSNQAE